MVGVCDAGIAVGVDSGESMVASTLRRRAAALNQRADHLAYRERIFVRLIGGGCSLVLVPAQNAATFGTAAAAQAIARSAQVSIAIRDSSA